MENSKKKVIIVDYKLGNLFSVMQAISNIGLNVLTTSDSKELNNADAIVLPGVGAFSDAMKNLRTLNLENPLKEAISSGKPFLGICLGLQLLFDESEEFGQTPGLGLIKGIVRRFNNTNRDGSVRKVPQIAWNQIHPVKDRNWDNTPLQDIKAGEYMYFVHSFYVEPLESVGISQTNYDGHTYISAIYKNNMFACQFHPEKSAHQGLKIYYRWAKNNNLI
jgi:glutamine amidotransferase